MVHVGSCCKCFFGCSYSAMSVSCSYKFGVSSHSSSITGSLDQGSKLVTEKNSYCVSLEETKDRIKKLFDKVELSVSAYDTAWVAMVPSPISPQDPCFPECINWLLDNQHSDGSWGFHHHQPFLTKDALSSTLACVLALKSWDIGERQMRKGLEFIELNFASISDDNQLTPVGFDIIFPGMIEYAQDLSLNLPLKSTEIDAMLQRRDMELRSGSGSNSVGREAYLAYVSEGMGELQNWETVMKFQRKNGSLFNSPSTTAAALTQVGNAGCLYYLQSLLEKFKNAVPTVYPLDMYARLCMVDCLESLGIDWHFRKEIQNVLDETYRCWLQGEEILLDLTTCALAFRILRTHGYDVSSDPLHQFAEEDYFFNSLGGYLKDIGAALELFRASQMILHPDEFVLEKQNSWTSQFLKKELSNLSTDLNRISRYNVKEVADTLHIPYHGDLERLAHRRKIENYCVDDTRLLKTSYCLLNISNADFLKLSVEDFNMCQSIHLEELKLLERWFEERRLDKLKFASKKLAYCYFSAAATMFSPELSDARISWAKNGVLTTVVDDFFDVGGSEEELANLVQLVEKWDVNIDADCCSEQVEIIFSAVQSTISEIGDKAFACQGRDVTSHIIRIWLDLLKSMLQEAEWSRNKLVPTLDEYMKNGYVSFALGPIVLPAVYFVGSKLSEEIIRSTEFEKLFELMSTCGRLQNDIHGFKRESEEGKKNAVSLHIIHGNGTITEEETIRKIKSVINHSRRELLRLVLQEKGSIVPRPCKDLFWKMSKVLHFFYMKNDGFRLEELMNVVKHVLHEPIILGKF